MSVLKMSTEQGIANGNSSVMPICLLTCKTATNSLFICKGLRLGFPESPPPRVSCPSAACHHYPAGQGWRNRASDRVGRNCCIFSMSASLQLMKQKRRCRNPCQIFQWIETSHFSETIRIVRKIPQTLAPHVTKHLSRFKT